MSTQTRTAYSTDQANPYAGSSLVPMLVIGLMLALGGMIVALALS